MNNPYLHPEPLAACQPVPPQQARKFPRAHRKTVKHYEIPQGVRLLTISCVMAFAFISFVATPPVLAQRDTIELNIDEEVELAFLIDLVSERLSINIATGEQADGKQVRRRALGRAQPRRVLVAHLPYQ